MMNMIDLKLQVWDVSSLKKDEIIGGATFRLFNSKKQLKSGQQKLRLWPGVKADGSVPTTTPGKVNVQRFKLRSLDPKLALNC